MYSARVTAHGHSLHGPFRCKALRSRRLPQGHYRHHLSQRHHVNLDRRDPCAAASGLQRHSSSGRGCAHTYNGRVSCHTSHQRVNEGTERERRLRRTFAFAQATLATRLEVEGAARGANCFRQKVAKRRNRMDTAATPAKPSNPSSSIAPLPCSAAEARSPMWAISSLRPR